MIIFVVSVKETHFQMVKKLLKKNSNCNPTKKNSICDLTYNLEVLPNSKTQIVKNNLKLKWRVNLKKSKFYQTQKLKLRHNLHTKIVREKKS